MRRTHLLLAVVLITASATRLDAQLRPLDPLEWSVFEPGQSVTAWLGAGLLDHQRASLAGTEGRLIEAGNFGVVWRTGRIALEASGTMLRTFEDREVFAEPAWGANPPDGARRVDSGDFRVATAVRLTPSGSPAQAALRFGTRLPTTDDKIGLGRDRTDFFALIAGRLARGPFSLSAETGIGINGSHHPEFEQVDTWIYSATLTYRHRWLAPRLSFTGHWDGLPGWYIRGNEDLRELRLGVRAGGRTWVQVTAVHGLAEYSPGAGLLVSAGITR